MKLNKFLEGLAVLRPHWKDPDGHHLGADHDVIYAYATDTPLSETELARLAELGWFQQDVADGDPYSPEDGWSAYV
jgi:hypothetical protein